MTTRSPFLSLSLARAADLDDLAHRLVAEDVAGQHGGDEVVEEVKVGAADRAARHLDDRIAGILDLRIRHRVVTDVLLAVPDQGFHANLLRWAEGQFPPPVHRWAFEQHLGNFRGSVLFRVD